MHDSLHLQRIFNTEQSVTRFVVCIQLKKILELMFKYWGSVYISEKIKYLKYFGFMNFINILLKYGGGDTKDNCPLRVRGGECMFRDYVCLFYIEP